MVLSVPFKRLVKHSLSIPLIAEISKNSDIVVVAPFEMSQQDKKFFLLENVTWIYERNDVSEVTKFLLSSVDLIRRFGYWELNKHSSLEYYSETKSMEFRDNGKTITHSLLRRLIYILLSLFGRERKRWLVIEKSLSILFPKNDQLVQLASSYEGVTIIQSANWGIQDRVLARLSEKHNWKSFLLPYTVDQLYTNGYLFTDYDGIFVQGPFEKSCATEFHKQPEKNLIELGNSWFRNIDYLSSKVKRAPYSFKKKILYAGVSSVFYPLESELKAVELIDELISKNFNNEYELVYRPVLFDENQKKYVAEKVVKMKHVTVDWPDVSIIALADDSDENFESDLKSYVLSLQSVDIFVMSYLTSMCMDVNYVNGCKVISNMIDDTGCLAFRKTHLFPNSFLGKNLIVVTTYDGLLERLSGLMTIDYGSQPKDRAMADLWDYPANDYPRVLKLGLEGVKG